MSDPSLLLSPFELGGSLQLKNRVVMAPLTRARSGSDRIPNAVMTEYYRQRASAGLIISEATVVSEMGIGWVNTPGIYNDAQVRGWQQVVKAVHAAGGRMFLQLWHQGRASHSSFHHGKLPVAPSAIKLKGEGVQTPAGKQPYETPHALTIEEIRQTVMDYQHGAALAMQAGFDGVEIHAANGYLIDQFLQSRTNHRDDEYGGTIEKRYRFLDEIVNAIIQSIPAGRVGIRLSPNGMLNDMGSEDYRETFLYAAGQLDKYSLAYLHVIDGVKFGYHELGPPMTLPEFRAVFNGPLIGNCGYTKENAERAIAAGDADLIAFGRIYISNPDLVERFANDWPLAEEAPMEYWYMPREEGYIDYPSYQSDSN